MPPTRTRPFVVIALVGALVATPALASWPVGATATATAMQLPPDQQAPAPARNGLDAPAPVPVPAPALAPPQTVAVGSESTGQPAPPVAADVPIFEKWWFWTAIAAVAVTTVVIVATSSGPSAPQSDLGTMTAF